MFVFRDKKHLVKWLLVLAMIFLPVSKLLANTHSSLMVQGLSDKVMQQDLKTLHDHDLTHWNHVKHDQKSDKTSCEKQCSSCAFCSVTMINNVIITLPNTSSEPLTSHFHMSGIFPDVETYPPKH